MTDLEYTNMRGTPYLMRRRIILGPTGLPCTPPPFGALVAVSLSTGGIAWNVPLGTMGGLPGSINLGGPIVTAGGSGFIMRRLGGRRSAFAVSGRRGARRGWRSTAATRPP